MIESILPKMLGAFLHDQRGSHAMEFAFVVMLISLVILPVAQMFGERIALAFAIYFP